MKIHWIIWNINETFAFIEIHEIGTREFLKAKYTKELLGLNSRQSLTQARKAAYKFYFSNLKRYYYIKNAVSLEEIELITDDIMISNKDFKNIKNNILTNIKDEIIKYSHPTVWHEMKRQRVNLP